MRLHLITILLLAQFSIGTAPCQAQVVIELGERLAPGGLMIGKVPPGSQVNVDGDAVRVSEEGDFIFGVGRDAEGSVEVVIDCPDGNRIMRRIAITDRDYEVQRIDGLPKRKVEPNKDDQERIAAEHTILVRTKAIDSAELGFVSPVLWPVIGPISGVFGSQRVLNGRPRSPHRGVDVAAVTGTPVKAMMDGVVTLAEDDMYFTGGTVMVDHGHGLQSIYAHLSEVSVDVGQRLQAGGELGKIGATGRVTGPHLHFGLYWFETALDPALILGPMPNAAQ